MTSHEGADFSQYGGRVECADSDGSASGCGVVTAGGCTRDGSAVAINEVVLDSKGCSQRAVVQTFVLNHVAATAPIVSHA